MRIVRRLFLHVGTLTPIVAYFVACGNPPYAPAAVRHALDVAVVTSIAYIVVARALGEAKQFDVGMLVLFAVGALGVRLPGAPLLPLYQRYSSALVFAAFLLTALVPLVVGREPFTVHYARRQVPAWQQRLPFFMALNRVIAAWWVLVFGLATALCIQAPGDPRFTFVYPNLAVLVLGLPAAVWLPLVYLRVFPPPLPDAIEGLLMGMPFLFDRRAAAGARARVQFHVTGAEAGDWWLRVEGGTCATFAGTTPSPDVAVHTPDVVWRRIARGELDGTQALVEGLYRAEGDVAVLAKLAEWFPVRRA